MNIFKLPGLRMLGKVFRLLPTPANLTPSASSNEGNLIADTDRHIARVAINGEYRDLGWLTPGDPITGVSVIVPNTLVPVITVGGTFTQPLPVDALKGVKYAFVDSGGTFAANPLIVSCAAGINGASNTLYTCATDFDYAVFMSLGPDNGYVRLGSTSGGGGTGQGATGGGDDAVVVNFDRYIRNDYQLLKNGLAGGPLDISKELDCSITVDATSLHITVVDSEERGHLCAVNDTFELVSYEGTNALIGSYTVTSVTDMYTLVCEHGISSPTIEAAQIGVFEKDVVLEVGTERVITSIASNGTEITVITDGQHTLSRGEELAVDGTAHYNGEYTVHRVLSLNSFTVLSSVSLSTELTGTVREYNAVFTIS